MRSNQPASVADLAVMPPRTRVCARTGLGLCASREIYRVWRIAKTSYGPLNPPLRGSSSEDRTHWGRYDVPGHRVVYGASTKAAAYAEALAPLRVGLGINISDLFDDERDGLDSSSLLDVAGLEWAGVNHMGPGRIAAVWRHERCLYSLNLPPSGWFVDIERAESMSTIAKSLGGALAARRIPALTVGVLRGENRYATTDIATWLRGQVLDDGSLPHGIKFGSKHGGTWTCWAIWLRAVDDGKHILAEPTKANHGVEIKGPGQNADLDHVATLFGLRCF